MNISEPMTLVTDYLLAAVTAWLAVLLFRNAESQSSRKCWAAAFSALALGAFLGGTWHGLVQSAFLWKATVLAVGVASFGMVAGSAIATVTGAARKLILRLALVKLLVYSGWMMLRDDFIFVIVDTGIAFAVVAGLHVWKWNRLLLAGVAVSVAGAAVQASGFALHPHFNHNDLYHVIQIAAMALFYRGARRLTDSVALR
ncbi:MAG TPA: hypothetical protein VGX52_04930 [Burkholderiales bacterium]|nr:hypothetical protein [Burkholderiales bacterium]